jgi:hypothetical protein
MSRRINDLMQKVRAQAIDKILGRLVFFSRKALLGDSLPFEQASFGVSQLRRFASVDSFSFLDEPHEPSQDALPAVGVAGCADRVAGEALVTYLQ